MYLSRAVLLLGAGISVVPSVAGQRPKADVETAGLVDGSPHHFRHMLRANRPDSRRV